MLEVIAGSHTEGPSRSTDCMFYLFPMQGVARAAHRRVDLLTGLSLYPSLPEVLQHNHRELAQAHNKIRGCGESVRFKVELSK